MNNKALESILRTRRVARQANGDDFFPHEISYAWIRNFDKFLRITASEKCPLAVMSHRLSLVLMFFINFYKSFNQCRACKLYERNKLFINSNFSSLNTSTRGFFIACLA